jgi:hypothetical protein
VSQLTITNNKVLYSSKQEDYQTQKWLYYT